MRTVHWIAAVLTTVLALGATPLLGQFEGPFDSWADYELGGYAEVPSAPALNPGDAMTVEAWIYLNPGHDTDDEQESCDSIVGKDFEVNYWLGVCDRRLRSYVGGVDRDSLGFDLPLEEWVHVAMSTNGTLRRHYVDGSLIDVFAESGDLTPSPAPLRIGSDVSWEPEFDGSIDEVRLWDRVVGLDELRRNARYAVERPLPGLVAVWDFAGAEEFGQHPGNTEGTVLAQTFPVTRCWNTSTQLCLAERFEVTATWTTADDSGEALIVPPDSEDTGLLWFFAAANWEVMVKVLDACEVNDQFWVFIAASTDQGYQITVRDRLTGEFETYSKEIGPPAPAITDTSALAVCNPF